MDVVTVQPDTFFNVYLYVAAIASCALLGLHYTFNVVQKPEVITGNVSLLRFLDLHLPSLKLSFWPSWFCWEGRLQSTLGLNLRMCVEGRLDYTRELIHLSDGGQLGVDYLGEGKDEGSKDELFVVLLIPGLTSSSQTSYVKTLALSVIKAGCSVAVMNNRGLGGVPLLTPRTYCASNSDDVREVISHVRRRYPNSRMMGIGTSLGGMILANYLINYPEETVAVFEACLVISTCWDAVVASSSLENSYINKLINTSLTKDLHKVAKRHQSVLENHPKLNFNKILSTKTVREFDEHFTAPIFGFSSHIEYYEAASVNSRLDKLSIPLIGLSAVDDPMQPREGLPIDKALSPHSKLALITTSRGGHLGFLDGVLPLKSSEYFMERLVGELVKAVKDYPEEILKGEGIMESRRRLDRAN